MYTHKYNTLFIIISVFLLTGCLNSDSPQTTRSEPDKPVAGGTYRRAFADSYIVLDPAIIKDSNSHEVCRQIYDGLVELDNTGNPSPAIAQSWEISENKLLYSFKLRKDVRFHSISGGKPTLNKGRLLTAGDVVKTFQRLLTPSTDSQGALFHVIKGAKSFSEGKATELTGVRAISSDVVEFELEQPFAPFLVLLGACNAFIIPAEDAENEQEPLKDRPVGTGAFYWHGKEGETIVLKANENYFRGRPYLDKIEFPIIGGEYERFRLFKEGKLMHVDVPDSEYKNVKQDPVLYKCLLETSRWGTNYLGMNTEVFPFDNRLVRQAINYSIDRAAIVKLVLNDRARVANGVLPPGIVGFNQNFSGYSYNLEKARELLAEAGYPGGKGFPEIVLQYNKDIIHARIGEFVLANLNDLGIKCKVRELDFGEHLKTVESGEATFFRMGWTVDYPDPDSFLHTLFHSSNIKTGYNFSRINVPELDRLLDEARFETTQSRRIELYQQAEQLIFKEAPWVFLYFYTTHLLHLPEVKGLTLGPMGQPFINYRKIWLQQKAKNN
jgi:peptide/nickel transport system substrate-binding protein/oligopeptide transport system substrate-binding protein